MRHLLFTFFALAGMACAHNVAATPPPGHEHAHEHEHEHSDPCEDDDRDQPGQSPPGVGGGTIDETRQVKPNGKVDVHEFAGSVRVTGWAQNVVHVHAKVSGDCRVEVSPSGDRTEVRLECRRGPGSGEIEIQMPQPSSLEVRTMSATVSVRDVSGALHLQTVAGDIDVKGGTPTEVDARSTTGSVKIEAASPSTRAHSVSGDVHVAGVRGRASIRTVSGECTLSGGEFNEVGIESVSGDVTFTGAVAGQGTFEMQSHSGDLVLHLPATTAADVEMRSFSGDLLLDMGAGQKTAERELDARIGAGGAKLRLHTFSGDVKVTR